MYLGASLARIIGSGSSGTVLLRRQEWLPAILTSNSFKQHTKCDTSTRTIVRDINSFSKISDKQLLLANSSYYNPTRTLNLAAKAVESFPHKFQPFLKLSRLDKPIGTWLLFWPCGWSTCLATSAGHVPDIQLLAMFGLGSLVMRGAGCTINDMWDRNIDRQVRHCETMSTVDTISILIIIMLG